MTDTTTKSFNNKIQNDLMSCKGLEIKRNSIRSTTKIISLKDEDKRLKTSRANFSLQKTYGLKYNDISNTSNLSKNNSINLNYSQTSDNKTKDYKPLKLSRTISSHTRHSSKEPSKNTKSEEKEKYSKYRRNTAYTCNDLHLKTVSQHSEYEKTRSTHKKAQEANNKSNSVNRYNKTSKSDIPSDSSFFTVSKCFQYNKQCKMCSDNKEKINRNKVNSKFENRFDFYPEHRQVYNDQAALTASKLCPCCICSIYYDNHVANDEANPLAHRRKNFFTKPRKSDKQLLASLAGNSISKVKPELANRELKTNENNKDSNIKKGGRSRSRKNVSRHKSNSAKTNRRVMRPKRNTVISNDSSVVSVETYYSSSSRESSDSKEIPTNCKVENDLGLTDSVQKLKDENLEMLANTVREARELRSAP